jgi:predicted TIM-barrel fold metal-dependent hydrolase
MISRRDALIGAAIAGAAALVRRPMALLAAASQPSTPVNFQVPAGACDCHTHIFGDLRRFPFIPARTYTPEPASVDEMRALHRALRTDRVVIVQVSVYGTDNACMLDAMKQIGSSARGVAVIDEKTPDGTLDEMDRAGVRGIRVNLATVGVSDPAVGRQRFQAAVARLRGRNWHIQMYTTPPIIDAIKDDIVSAGVPLVFDHFGGAQGSLGIHQPGFDALLELVRAGRVYVKLSGPYRGSTNAPDYADMAPLAKALIAANPQRVLWGTDWPHPDTSSSSGRAATDVAPHLKIDDGRVFNLLPAWAPDASQRKAILVENPAKLYGF